MMIRVKAVIMSKMEGKTESKVMSAKSCSVMLYC